MKYKVSANVIKRLPRYVRRLDWLTAEKIEKVSSSDLGRQLGLTASQIRQDFNCFGGFGQQGYGYNVHQLRSGIAGVLGMEQTLTAIVIGAGNLGHALIANFHFDECGVELKAAFDNAAGLIGTSIAATPVLDVAGLEDYLKENKTDVAVLTLPKIHATDTAKLLASSGVRGIWNFTGVDIDADLGDVIVENVHLSDSLLNLGYYLRDHGGDQRPEHSTF
ncbi:MAG: redox-sensing transcriptional repressor Rex [Oscillospiraceae bacterium]